MVITNKMTTKDPLLEQKDLALYSATIDAWVETRMEKDKTLLQLASAGIGLLVTLLTTVGPTSGRQLWLYGAAGLTFIVTIVTAVLIFDRNSHHLEAVAVRGLRGNDALLVWLDKVLFISFILGVALTGGIALSAGFSKLPSGGSMSEQKVVSPQHIRSLTGIGNLGAGTQGGGNSTGDSQGTSNSSGQNNTNGGTTSGEK